jgi:hypothetical protein
LNISHTRQPNPQLSNDHKRSFCILLDDDFSGGSYLAKVFNIDILFATASSLKLCENSRPLNFHSPAFVTNIDAIEMLL